MNIEQVLKISSIAVTVAGAGLSMLGSFIGKKQQDIAIEKAVEKFMENRK